MYIQTTILTLVGLVCYLGHVSSSSIQISYVEERTGHPNNGLDQLDVSYLGLTEGRQMDSSDFGHNVEQFQTTHFRFNVDRRTKASRINRYEDQSTKTTNHTLDNDRRTETVYTERNIERPMKASSLDLNFEWLTKMSDHGIAYGYATDKMGYKCAYFVPSARTHHGPRYLLITCSMLRKGQVEAYRCNYKGFPLRCTWYGINVRPFYRMMANHIVHSNDGKCDVKAMTLRHCTDAEFRLF